MNGNWDKERRAPRARVEDVVLLQRDACHESLIADLTDISALGIGIAAEGISPGEKFTVSMAVGPMRRVVRCSAVVRHANGRHHGLEFLELSETLSKLLADSSAIN